MPPKAPLGCIREALKALDELESNQTCNDFDLAQEALSDLEAVEARVAELEACLTAIKRDFPCVSCEHRAKDIVECCRFCRYHQGGKP